jgi:DNA gyrase subunit B
VVIAVKARKAAKAAKDSVLRKGALEGMTLPGKLADCQTKSLPKNLNSSLWRETLREVRQKWVAIGEHRQFCHFAVKILNVERARLDRMLASEQVKNLVVALGTAIGDVFDLSKASLSHKIIIATDADVDGAHIRTLSAHAILSLL